MARPRSQFVCQQCGAAEPRWTGRCARCQAWNTMVEHTEPAWSGGRGSAGGGARARHPQGTEAAPRSLPITEVAVASGGDEVRLSSGIAAADRVLGGGVVPGSLVLLGGDPGVGKSTLLLQVLAGLARAGAEERPRVLYVSGEESLGQTAQRARRLGAVVPGLHLYCETRLQAILEEAERLRPQVLAIDSIQMLLVDEVDALPGSLNQIREATMRLMPFAKRQGIAVLLVGHVTKDGALAGPKTLEHMVDAVLLFEGERGHPYRVLRASKNRFGAVSEIGVFEMRDAGLREVPDPSALFLQERPEGAAGSVVTAAIEGSLPLLIEVQALCASAATVPRRTALGIDPYRVAMLLAVIERHVGIDVLGLDVFVNVAGGFRLTETAADLAVAAALCSSATSRLVAADAICFGEVGLSGEVRRVAQAEARLLEARKLGFRRCILPAATATQLARQERRGDGMEIIGVRSVAAAIDALLGERVSRQSRFAADRTRPAQVPGGAEFAGAGRGR